MFADIKGNKGGETMFLLITFQYDLLTEMLKNENIQHEKHVF